MYLMNKVPVLIYRCYCCFTSNIKKPKGSMSNSFVSVNVAKAENYRARERRERKPFPLLPTTSSTPPLPSSPPLLLPPPPSPSPPLLFSTLIPLLFYLPFFSSSYLSYYHYFVCSFFLSFYHIHF